MDIHPPHGAINSWREFLLHLLTITIGILIALSFEGLIEWRHHRGLVREAESNIAAEIRSNAAELKTTEQELRTSDEQLQQVLAVIHHMEADRKFKPTSVVFNWTVAELHQTSWSTANSTGALGYMDYEEAKRYTRVYDLQQEFMALQQRALQSSLSVQALSTLLSRDTTTISAAELSEAERTAGLALANARALEQVGQALSEQYAGFR